MKRDMLALVQAWLKTTYGDKASAWAADGQIMVHIDHAKRNQRSDLATRFTPFERRFDRLRRTWMDSDQFSAFAAYTYR